MTRIPYDQTAKQLLDAALEGAGRAKVQHEVSSEPQWIDVWFERDAAKPLPPGVFGRMIRDSCAFEVFHGNVKIADVLDCLAKQLGVYRRRRRKRSPTRAASVPPMWLIVTERPNAVLTKFLAVPVEDWPAGFYRTRVPALPLHIITLRELPRVRETLVLRLMGAKTVLEHALQDLDKLPYGAWERTAAMGPISVLHSLAAKASRLSDPNEKVIVMNATALYEKIKEEGRKEGRDEGSKSLLLQILSHRFGELPRIYVTRVNAADSAQLERWGKRLVGAVTLDDVFGRKKPRRTAATS